MARAGLDRPRIVGAAIDLLDEGGIDALTARRIAARLGVQAGALYYHLPDKRTLVDEIATELLREMLAEGGAVAGWEELLRGTAERMRTVLNRHRDGARVFAGSRILDAGLLGAMEQPLQLLVEQGFELTEAVWSMQTVLHFTVGFLIEEQHRRDEEPEDYRPDVRRARLDDAETPLTVAASEPLLADPDRQFAFGLDLIVDGVRARRG